MTHNELKVKVLDLKITDKSKVSYIKDAAEEYIRENGVREFARIFKDEEMMSASINHFGITIDSEISFHSDFFDSNESCQPENSIFGCKVATKLLSLQKRAQKINKPFDLTFSDVKRMYNRKRCQITGEPITLEMGRENSISFERIDANEGYTKDNVIIVCAWVNKLKNDLLESPEARFRHDQKNKIKSLAKMFTCYAERV